MADIISIPQIVWKILNISPQLLSKYTAVQDQLLWLIFIPTLIFVFFIYWFATAVTLGHKGFRNLFGIAAYLTIVLTGWYGKLIPLFITWWWIVLGLGIFLFLLSAVFKPGKSREMLVLGGALGQAATGKFWERREMQKKVKYLEDGLHDNGFDPNKDPTSQPKWDKLDDKSKDTITNKYMQLAEARKKAKEWI